MRRLSLAILLVVPLGTPAADPDSIRWLEERSMLRQAADASRGVSGHGEQWRHRYGEPRPLDAVRLANVWLLDYPGSVIPRPGESVLATWGDPGLWDALGELGVDLLHTGPVSRAGGVRGREYTPTLDGWFDRISLDLDPGLGSEEEYARMVAVAAKHGARIAGDLVPLHTGIGPDFRLALRGHKDYPGMYTMAEVAKDDWPLLPAVAGPDDFAHVSKEAAESLAKKGYIPGPINSNDADPAAKQWSGWSASGEVEGTDGTVRRWVYLHYFKPSQPALNWLDPSYAARRAVAGDAVRTVRDRKTPVVRLDAVPFLGIEKKADGPGTLHFKHPLSVVGTNDVSMLVRKLGGYSFQELNVPLRELKAFSANGPDLSYDFVTRAQCLHALLAEDAGPLRLSFRWMLEAGTPPVGFVHDLQNHDEITYQLTEPEGRKDETFTINGKRMTGKELREGMLKAMRERTAGDTAPYNRLYRPEKDGLATTFAGFVAPALGIADPYRATPEEVERIRQGHLVLAAANALQPGVFSLSSWDIVGALPVDSEAVRKRAEGGDFRWHNRGGVDLTGASPKADASAIGQPRAKTLYGPLPAQLKDPRSFASRLKAMLAARKKHRVAEAELLDVPELASPAVCVLVLKLPDGKPALAAFNFGRTDATEEIAIKTDAGTWTDAVSGKEAGTSDGGRVRLRLPALTGMLLVR